MNYFKYSEIYLTISLNEYFTGSFLILFLKELKFTIHDTLIIHSMFVKIFVNYLYCFPCIFDL